jgi:hypothetical protein
MDVGLGESLSEILGLGATLIQLDMDLPTRTTREAYKARYIKSSPLVPLDHSITTHSKWRHPHTQ